MKEFDRIEMDGIELPLYDGGLVLGSEEIRKQSNPTTRTVKDDQFLRILKLNAPQLTSLAEALQTTDHELQEVARHCGAKVIDHTWGLTRTDELRPEVFCDGGIKSDKKLVPEPFTLVALVNVINAKPLNPETEDLLSSRIFIYMSYEGLLTDMFPEQFSFGAEHNSSYQGLILHDIDPWIPNAGNSTDPFEI